MGVFNCSMFCFTLLHVHSSIAIILMGKRRLVALLNLSSWCLVMVERLFLVVPRGCLRFVNVVFSDHTHLLFFSFQSTNDLISIGNKRCFVTYDTFSSQRVENLPYGKKSYLQKGGITLYFLTKLF